MGRLPHDRDGARVEVALGVAVVRGHVDHAAHVLGRRDGVVRRDRRMGHGHDRDIDVRRGTGRGRVAHGVGEAVGAGVERGRRVPDVGPGHRRHAVRGLGHGSHR